MKGLALHRNIPTNIVSLNVDILYVNIGMIERSQQIKAYGLLSNDALVLQAMKESGLSILASNDADFKKVDFIATYQPAETARYNF